MTLRFFRRFRPLQHGFSLVEMLVAVMFIGILSAGMLRIYSSNLAGFQRVNDMISTQRRGRWALASLQDDVASIGYFAFVPFSVPSGYSVTPGTQEPFMILPSPTPVVVTGPDPANPAALVTAPLVPNPDELQFVGDIPLPIQATVNSNSANAVTVSMISGNLSDLQDGDAAAALDGGAGTQLFKVAGPVSGLTITVQSGSMPSSQSTSPGIQPWVDALNIYPIATPLAFFRPNMVTRYSVQARAWDPSNPAITVPCLVRQVAPYPLDYSLINWAGVQADVIAENIEGFTVDISFDGGTTWLRQGSANWDAIVTKMQALSPGGKALNPRDSHNPLWFRNFPCLIRMDVTSRSAAPKAASADASGQAAYVRRTQTLMVTPRNFGLPLD